MVDASAIGSAQTAGLPDGLMALARRLWFQAGHTERLTPPTESAVPDDVDRQLERMLFAPLTLEPDWPAPATPIRVPGGFIHAEILDEDRTTLDAIIDANDDRGPEALAAAAQEMRLPVCPYRRPALTGHVASKATAIADRAEPGSASGKTVLDLSTHWAGPLATSLLADAGAKVIKVDPACRPDGFGARPRLYDHLNGSKEIIDLDLRLDEDRSRFEVLVASADLLVESFSRRVMTNLGYDQDRLRHLSPSLCSVSIKAFSSGSPERDWVGYGPAVHAVSGLAYSAGSERSPEDVPPSPAAIAYPDFLAGLSAYGEALRLLSGENCSNHVEVSLMASMAPLLTNHDPGVASGGALRDESVR